MKIVLSFAPFIIFPIVAGFAAVQVALAAALFAALVVSAIDVLSRRAPKILNLGTLALFAVLTTYGAVLHPGWNALSVRLAVNAGLLLIALGSVALARPFTLQYAREEVPRELWNAPLFVTTNYRITWVWIAAFAATVGENLMRLFASAVPPVFDTAVNVAALAAAYSFTRWYPNYVRRSAQRSSRP